MPSEFERELARLIVDSDELVGAAALELQVTVAALHDDLVTYLSAANISAADIAAIQANVDAMFMPAALEILRQGMNKHQEAWLLGQGSANRLFGVFEVEGLFTITTAPEAFAATQALTVNRIVGITEQMRLAIRSEIIQTVMAGQSPLTAMQNITNIVGIRDMAGFRELGSTGLNYKAERILRTELHAVEQMARFLAIEDRRVSDPKIIDAWMSTGDIRTRDTHLAAHGQRKDQTENGIFWVGGFPCEFPGDVQLPAQERINCRCEIFSYKEDWGTMDELMGGLNQEIIDEKQRRVDERAAKARRKKAA